jgi:hypothetical protein
MHGNATGGLGSGCIAGRTAAGWVLPVNQSETSKSAPVQNG